MVLQETAIKKAFEQPQWYLNKTAFNIRIRVETLREFIGCQKPQDILDIGCGDGSLSLSLLNEKNRITLLDQSRTMLDLALSRVPDEALNRVTALNENFMSASLPRQAFDLIISVGVLAYVEDRDAFLGKVAAALKPGGTLVIECTDADHFVTHLIRGYATLKRWSVGDRFKTISRPSSELLQTLQQLGFELRGSFRYSLPLPVMQRFLSQQSSYKGVRSLYGCATRNRRATLGNECIYCLKAAGSKP